MVESNVIKAMSGKLNSTSGSVGESVCWTMRMFHLG